MEEKKKNTKKKNKNKEIDKEVSQKQKDVEAIFKTSPSSEIKEKKGKKSESEKVEKKNDDTTKQLLEEIEKTVKINVDKIVLEQAKINEQEKEYNVIEKEKYKGIVYVTLGFLVICLLLMVYTINNTNVKVKSLEEAIEKRITKTKYVSPTTIFYGDSITEQYKIEKYFNNSNYLNKGISGNTTEDTLKTISERVLQYHPKQVVILIGTNDIPRDVSNDKIASNIEEMVLKIKDNNENTKIFIESILPINDTDEDKINKDMVNVRTNEQIKKINKLIENICKKHNITYIDTYSKMVDKDDQLNIDYTKEGLHLNDSGYQKLTAILKEYIK